MTFEASRRKQVLVLQPKGKALYDDDSSFGSRMLAKMGWNKGSGLGKEQHGSVDFIQVRYKNNANGLGFNGLKDDQWTENESNFDDLLKSLNNANSNPGSNSVSGDEQLTTEKKSLEEKSKLSRARVHYKKFTKGKDVHKYSEKDLANILGKKSLKEEPQKEKPEEVEEEVEDEKPGIYDSNLIINKGISVTDYFKEKMKAKMQKPTEESDNQDEGEVKKKKKKRKIEEAESEVPEKTEEIEEEKKSKKKKKKVNSDEDQEVKKEEPEVIEEPVKKKKSKKNREFQEVAEEPAEEPPAKKKKKNKRKAEEPEEIPVESSETSSKKKSKKEIESAEESTEPPSKKKKKNKKEPEAPPVVAPKKKTTGEPQRGANAVYSTNIIQIPSHVAQKLSSMSIHDFKRSNLANVVGYGLSEDIEIKTVQTKIGENIENTDKYALFNMDRMTTRAKGNNRKIISKIKRTKKSIQVI